MEELAKKIEENKEPLKVWARRIKIAVAVLFLVSTAFMNGLFTGSAISNEGALVDRSMISDMASWNNLIVTIRESWFAIVAIIAYLCLNEYNKRLDLEEQRLVELQQREEKQYEVDDSETSSQDSGVSSGGEPETKVSKEEKSTAASRLADELAA